MLFEIIRFILFVILFLVFPAKTFFYILKIDKREDCFIDFGLSMGFGLVLLTGIMLITRFSGLNFQSAAILPLLSFLCLVINKEKWKKIFLIRQNRLKPHFSLYILIIVLFGVITQNLVLFRGGWRVLEGLVFPSAHDTMWSLAIFTELTHHFPPQHPGMAGEMLKNHHFFYPFFLAVIQGITNINVLDIYFRFGPVLVSLLFGLSIYCIASIFTKNYWFRGLTVFLGIFSGNFAYLAPLFLGSKFDWKGNTFFADQPFDQLINPYTVLGFSLFLFGVYAIYMTLMLKKKIHLGWCIVSSLFIGSLYGFKSFGGIIAMVALFVSTIPFFIIYKEKRFILPLLFSIFVFSPIFFFITDLSRASLYWAPGWLLTEMTSIDKLNLPILVGIEFYYRSINNMLGLAKIKLLQFLIYFVGNLGVRIFGIYYFVKVFIDRKRYGEGFKITIFYVFLATIISFFIPLFFNLGQNAYNIVQFTPYALLLLAILTSVTIEEVSLALVKRGKSKMAVCLVVVIVVLAIPVNVKNIISKLEIPKDLIKNEEIIALDFIKTNTNENDILLINPKEFSADAMYVSALSERRVFLASEGYSLQTGKDPYIRARNIANFFNMGEDKNFLIHNNISYVYLLKPFKKKFIEKQFEKLNAVPFFENNKVVIYKI